MQMGHYPKTTKMNNIILVLSFILLSCILTISYGAGECGRSSPDTEALKLIPCASAAKDTSSTPSASCCAQVKKIGRNPKCLCAVMMSNTAKASGVKPRNAISIPKRCNFANRPIGYKCGAYTLP